MCLWVCVERGDVALLHIGRGDCTFLTLCRVLCSQSAVLFVLRCFCVPSCCVGLSCVALCYVVLSPRLLVMVVQTSLTFALRYCVVLHSISLLLRDTLYSFLRFRSVALFRKMRRCAASFYYVGDERGKREKGRGGRIETEREKGRYEGQGKGKDGMVKRNREEAGRGRRRKEE